MELNGLEKLIDDKPVICIKCNGALEYVGMGHYKCTRCEHIMLDDYGKVKEYIETIGPAPAWQIAKATGVKRDKINILFSDGMERESYRRKEEPHTDNNIPRSTSGKMHFRRNY